MPSRRGMMTGGPGRAWLPAAVLVISAGRVLGQTAPGEPAANPDYKITAEPIAPGPADPSATNALLKRWTSDVLTRQVLDQLRSIETPGINSYRAAALGLRIAQRYAPNDAELLRQQLEAWESAQDIERTNSVARDLLKLEPRDTVVQLRVANARVAALQDADQRLKAYEGLVNSTLDVSVRSRLALDAAMLLRESGDERGFLDKLTQATTLDPTNKEAAALYVTYFLDKATEPRERFDLLCTVILADPLDAEAYRNLAFELRRRGAFKGAARFLEIARKLTITAEGDLNTLQLADYHLTVLDARGADRSLTELQRLLDVQRVRGEMTRETLRKQGRPVPPEEPVFLPQRLERLRLMIQVARFDDSGATVAMQGLKGSHERALQELADKPPKAAEGKELAPEDRPDSVRRQMVLEYLWERIFAGLELESVDADLDELARPGAEGGAPLSAEAVARFKGWLLAIRGQTAEAKRVLEPLAAADSTAAWALALAHYKEGATDEALKIYERLARSESASTLGSAARLRWERISGKVFPVSDTALMLDKASATFAPWLDVYPDDARAFMTLTVKGEQEKIAPMERVLVRIGIRNNSPIPLAVGNGKPINSRILLGVRMVINGRDISTQVRPEFVSLARRLKLDPGEMLEVVLWPGRGEYGRYSDARLTSPASLRWAVTQGFEFTSQGVFITGPNCSRAESGLSQRLPMSNAVEASELARLVLTQPSAPLLDAITLATYRLNPSRRESDLDPVPQQDAATLAAAVAERLPKMSPDEKTFTLFRLKLLKALDDTTRPAAISSLEGETDAGLLAMAALVLVQDESDALMQRLEASVGTGDPELREFLSLVKSDFNLSKVIQAPVKLQSPEDGASEPVENVDDTR